jgi:hypothetical protein
VFRQSPKYTKDIYDEYVGSDFTFERFRGICNSCWTEDYGFLTTDKRKNYTMVNTEKVSKRPLKTDRLFLMVRNH